MPVVGPIGSRSFFVVRGRSFFVGGRWWGNDRCHLGERNKHRAEFDRGKCQAELDHFGPDLDRLRPIGTISNKGGSNSTNAVQHLNVQDPILGHPWRRTARMPWTAPVCPTRCKLHESGSVDVSDAVLLMNIRRSTMHPRVEPPRPIGGEAYDLLALRQIIAHTEISQRGLVSTTALRDAARSEVQKYLGSFLRHAVEVERRTPGMRGRSWV